MRPIAVALLVAVAVALACNQEPDAQFIPLQRDFQGFESWERFALEPEPDGGVHTGFARDIYLNHRPPPGSTEFPKGTIIVKHMDGAGSADGPRTFAMAKRGGTYNHAGALGWEWFELQPQPDGTAWYIDWRGVGPPAGGAYGSTDNGCNACHMEAQANDFVKAPVLDLKSF